MTKGQLKQLIKEVIKEVVSKNDDYSKWSKKRQENAAMNPNTPAGALAWLARNGTEWAQIYVARNPNTPAEALAWLARNGAEYARANAARNTSTPSETLDWLARNGSEWSQRGAAGNPSTPAETLEWQAFNGTHNVLWHLARNQKATGKALYACGRRGGESVWEGLFDNPSAPDSVFKLASEKFEGTELGRKAANILKKRSGSQQ